VKAQRGLTVADVAVGETAWAYARHYWREVRIVSKARTRVTVAYHLSVGGRLVHQHLAVWNLRLERPTNSAWAVDVAAPGLDR